MPRPALPLLLALPLLSALAAVPAPAEDAAAPAPPAATAPSSPADLPEGDFAPRVFVARQDGVPVRSDPGFVYREVNHLSKGTQVLVDGRKGPWLHVRPEGWVLAEHVEEPAPAPEGTTVLVVVKEGARVRSGPGTAEAPVRTLAKGAEIAATGQENGWWKLADGGYVFKDLVAPKGATEGQPPPPSDPSRGASPTSAEDFGTADADVRWSLMDMHGIIFEVSPIAPQSPFLPVLRSEMKAAGPLETDWTYLRVVITVPPGPFRFNYAPDTNATVILDGSGERYGSVYMRGPVERLPKPLRDLFTATTVEPGDTWAGVLLFRPTLDVARIRDVYMYVGGRLQKLYRAD